MLFLARWERKLSWKETADAEHRGRKEQARQQIGLVVTD
jgi:hypothetical protein